MPDLSLESLKKMIPQDELQKLEKGRELESDQTLQSLGYLQAIHSNNRPKILEAIQAFRRDYQMSQLLPHFAPPSPNAGELEEMEIELLERLLSLDGEIKLSQLPTIGQTTLYSRLLHYRLQLLGLYHKAINAPFTQDSLAGLQQLQQWIQGHPNLLGLANLCGHIPLLISTIEQRGGLDQRIVAFRYHSNTIDPDVAEEVAEEEGDEDDGAKAHLEKGWDKSLQDISEKVLGKEEALIQQYEHRNRNRKRRLERIEKLINKILAEQNALLQQSLQKEQDLLDAIAATDSRQEKRKLKRQLKRLREHRDEEQGQKQSQLQQLARRLRVLRAKVNGLRLRFKARLKKSLQVSAYEKISKEIFRQRSSDQLNRLIADPYNQFLIRLLQVSQWTSGYYDGQLDSQVGDQTFGAVVAMVEDLPRLQLKYILCKLGGSTEGFWLLNIQYLFSRFSRWYGRRGQDLSDSHLLEVYNQQFEESAPSTADALLQKTWDHYIKEQSQTGQGIVRRIYTGTRSLIRSMLGAIRRLAFFIKKSIERLSPLFKNFVRLLYKAIRAGVKKYGIGLAYLIVSGKLPQLNKQTVERVLMNFVEKLKAPDALIEGETGFVPTAEDRKKAKNLAFGVVLSLKVIRWAIALATGSVTWPRLAIQLALFFKDMIKEWVFKRQQGTQLNMA
ncbi:MAG: hypothetical protein AAFP19_05570 [Bacteroidota bacterium]